MVEPSPGALPPQTHTLPIDERIKLGRALRERLARKHHGAWKPAAGRRDPIEILIEQGESRLPDLLPVRYARMKATPFTFLRGAAAVMAADLAATPVSGQMVQAAGDCHCLNFGGFATPERRLAFDINDFDETAVAPWEWDLKRLATSFVVATLDVLVKEARTELAEIVARSYRTTMAEVAAMPVLAAWYQALNIDDEDTAEAIGIGARAVRKASPRAGASCRDRRDRPSRRHRPAHRRRSRARRLSPGARRCRRLPRRRRGGIGGLRRIAHARASHAPAALSPGRRGLQGGWGGRGRHAVRRAADGFGRRRVALPAVQGSEPLGARGPCRPQPLYPSRRTGGARPAPAAGRERHVAGLRHRSDRPSPLYPATARRQDQAAARDHVAAQFPPLCRDLRRGAGTRPCPYRRRRRHVGLSRQERRVRRGDRHLRQRLCQADRTRPRGPAEGHTKAAVCPAGTRIYRTAGWPIPLCLWGRNTGRSDLH